MMGTHDRIRLLILQDLELFKVGLIDDREIPYSRKETSKSPTNATIGFWRKKSDHISPHDHA